MHCCELVNTGLHCQSSTRDAQALLDQTSYDQSNTPLHTPGVIPAVPVSCLCSRRICHIACCSFSVTRSKQRRCTVSGLCGLLWLFWPADQPCVFVLQTVVLDYVQSEIHLKSSRDRSQLGLASECLSPSTTCFLPLNFSSTPPPKFFWVCFRLSSGWSLGWVDVGGWGVRGS